MLPLSGLVDALAWAADVSSTGEGSPAGTGGDFGSGCCFGFGGYGTGARATDVRE
jgi:hypothetical protein